MLNVNQMLKRALHDMLINDPDKLINRLSIILDGNVNVNSLFEGVPVDLKVRNPKVIIDQYFDKNQNIEIVDIALVKLGNDYEADLIYKNEEGVTSSMRLYNPLFTRGIEVEYL